MFRVECVRHVVKQLEEIKNLLSSLILFYPTGEKLALSRNKMYSCGEHIASRVGENLKAVQVNLVVRYCIILFLIQGLSNKILHNA